MQHDPTGSSSLDRGESPEHTVTTGAAQLRAPAAVALTAGSVIDGRYQIEAAIGEGGSGSVFRAWDRVLGEPVAIKILHPDRAREKAWINRLAREVRVARAIRHPNVCRVFDLGHADGHWFVTMELATGGALRQILRDPDKSSADRPLDERLADARALCAGLAAIHAVGIVHRDVTPQNVLRMKDGRLVLSDFGLAIENNDATTVHGGTPAYMPPEALLGGRSDQRSDVWQLGAILHELVFGKKPEWNRGANGTTMKMPLVAAASPVEEEVARLCGDCLAHDPAARPPTAMAVAGRLAAAEVARPRNWLVRQFRRVQGVWRQHRAVRVALVTAVLAVGAARGVQALTRQPLCKSGSDRLAGTWDPLVKAQVRKAFLATGQTFAADTFWGVNRVLEDYVQRWVGTYTEACEATHVRGEQSPEVLDLRMTCLQDRLGSLKALTAVFGQADGAVVENASNAVGQLGAIDRCNDVRLLRSVVPPPDNPDVRAQVEDLRHGLDAARAKLNSGLTREADRTTAPLVETARRLKYAPILGETLDLRGHTFMNLGLAAKAEETWAEGMLAAEEARDDETRAKIATSMVYVSAQDLSRAKETNNWAELSEAILRRIGGHERLHLWLANNMAGALLLRGEAAEAMRRLQHGMAIGEKALRSDDPDLMNVRNALVNALLSLGRAEEALAQSDRALEIGRLSIGAEHPMMAMQFGNRGEILNKLERWAESRTWSNKALAVWEKQLPRDHLYASYPLTAIGLSYLGEGKPGQALAPLERALTIRLTDKTTPSALVAETQFALARALWQSGAPRERARTLAADAVTNYDRAPNATPQRAEVTAWLDKHPLTGKGL